MKKRLLKLNWNQTLAFMTSV